MLSSLEKRDLLNRSAVAVSRLVQWGDQYREAGLLNDAIDFYERANDSEALEALRETISEQGDVFLYGRILKALGREASPQEWIDIGEKARGLGKFAFAREAFKRGGLEEAEEEKPEAAAGPSPT